MTQPMEKEMMHTLEVKPNEKKLMLAVATDGDNNYYVDLAAGSNVAETAFCVMCVIKCLVRDDIIKTPAEFTDLLNKYLVDPQYEEVKKSNADT